MANLEVVTILFTDIENSTRLAQQLRVEYAELLSKYRSAIRDILDRNGGNEIDVAGDGFFITFKQPHAAVLSAAEMQNVFNAQDWALDVGLKVRMGIHTGAALCSSEGCTGVEVHLAARVCDAAHGGQVLLTHSTRQLLEDAGGGLDIKYLGSFKFKDFNYPVQLYQLNVPGAPHTFPKPRIEPVDKRVAVLPFENQSEDEELEYLSEGLAEELIQAFGKVKGIRVVSRSAAFTMAEESRNIDEVSEKLRATLVVDGTIRLINKKLRISVELVDVATGTNIWSGSFDSSREDLFETQEEITRSIMQALELSLIPEQMEAIQDRQTHNPEAYDFYLRGRRFYWQFSTSGMELAIQMFRKAIEADANYALAFAGLADCYSYQFQHVSNDEEILFKADRASKKAIELAPSLAEGYVSQGIVLGLREKHEEANQYFQRAIEYDPTLFMGWFHYARMNFALGKIERAARLFEQAHRVEPDDYQSIFLAAQAYSDLGNDRLAYDLRKRGIEIADRMLALNPGDTRALYLAANALVFLDEHEKSLLYAKRALALEPEDSMVLYNVACVYALLNMVDEALTCLERSYEAGLNTRGWYQHDSNLDSVRDHPRFQALLEKMEEN